MPVDPLYDAVAQSLLVMEQILPRAKSAAQLTPEVVATWTEVLRLAGATPEQVKSAVPRLLQTEKFFPTPADFLKLLNPPEDKEAAEELAWQRVLTCLRKYGGTASLCASDLGGDEQALWALEKTGFERMWRGMDEEKRAIWRKEYVQSYQLAKKRGEGVKYLPGSFEQENLANGYGLTPIAAGRPDWKAFPPERSAQKSLPEGEMQPGLQSVQRALAESGVKP